MSGEINVLKNDKGMLEIELVNAEEGLGGLLVKYLNQEKGVEFAAYKKEHPFDTNIKIVIKAKKDSKKVLLSTIEKAKKEVSELDKFISKV